MGSLYRPMYPHPEGEVITKTGKRYKISQVWWVKYRANGRVIRESSGTDKEGEARRQGGSYGCVRAQRQRDAL
jgi:hypothetical protein